MSKRWAEIGDMVGVTMADVRGDEGDEELLFVADDGRRWRFYHSQGCCEHVQLEEVVGDLDDLIGAPLLQAEEVSSDGAPEPLEGGSYTWTFYTFRTIKGSVTVRWLGTSNGYYSEGVDFEEVTDVDAA